MSARSRGATCGSSDWFRCAVILGLVLAPDAIAQRLAHDPTNIGPGNMSCASYRQIESTSEKRGVDLWILGHVSGMNLRHYAEQKIDLLQTRSERDVLSFVDGYCVANRNADLRRAALEYWTQLVQRQPRAGDKRDYSKYFPPEGRDSYRGIVSKSDYRKSGQLFTFANLRSSQTLVTYPSGHSEQTNKVFEDDHLIVLMFVAHLTGSTETFYLSKKRGQFTLIEVGALEATATGSDFKPKVTYGTLK